MDAVKPISKGIQIGADIGQRVDPTAIVVAEMELRDYHYPDPNQRHPDDQPTGGDIHYVIRHVGRLPLGTSYPAVADRLAEIYGQLEPAEMPPSIEDRIRARAGIVRQRQRRVHAVLIDATGVGTPVVDLVRERGVRCTAVYLTGGEKATSEGSELRLAKGLMISRLQVLLQQRRIHLPQTSEAQALTEELLNYEIKVTESANLQMGVFKTGAHDDLATALGLACWEVPSGTVEFGYAPQEVVDFFGG